MNNRFEHLFNFVQNLRFRFYKYFKFTVLETPLRLVTMVCWTPLCSKYLFNYLCSSIIDINERKIGMQWGKIIPKRMSKGETQRQAKLTHTYTKLWSKIVKNGSLGSLGLFIDNLEACRTSSWNLHYLSLSFSLKSALSLSLFLYFNFNLFIS